jgi:predicted acyl esterase
MRTTSGFFTALVLAAVGFVPVSVAQSHGVTPDMVQTGSDIPAKWEEPHPGYDYERRDVLVPIRDGVKLHTVILVPKGAKGLPMLLERTPYNAGIFTSDKPKMRDAVWSAQREWVDDGYIIVDQDIRGKYGSEGDYVMTRPPIGPLNPNEDR